MGNFGLCNFFFHNCIPWVVPWPALWPGAGRCTTGLCKINLWGLRCAYAPVRGKASAKPRKTPKNGILRMCGCIFIGLSFLHCILDLPENCFRTSF